MDESSQPARRGAGMDRAAAAGVARAAMWASLVPLTLLLRPYGGLVQDARIYLGRGIADHDPTGVGRDILFSNDGQNRFSVMARVVDPLLDVMTPDAASALLVVLGLAAWLAAATALVLRLERGRAAWAVVVALLALPSAYGGFDIFGYAEAVATPRIFAEAAVLGGFAALLGGRLGLGLGLMLAAAVAHPLMAVPGIGVAAALLVRADRRWALPVAGAVAAVLAGALLGAPVVGRLLVPFDPEWAAVLRTRSVNLFPSLWTFPTYAVIARRLATVVVAASLLTGPRRALLLAGAAVASAGLCAAALLGDRWMMELVTQVQPWRSLWLLTVLSNAGFVLAAVRLWRGGDLDRLTLAALAAAWLASDLSALEIAAAAAALGLRAASHRGFAPRLPRRVAGAAVVVVACLMLFDVAQSGSVAAMLVAAARSQVGEPTWTLAVKSDLPGLLALLAALALACAPASVLARAFAARPTTVALGAAAGVAVSCVLGLLAFDQTSAEAGAARHPAATAALRDAIGPSPGEVMWIDEAGEAWTLAGRAAFFNAVQGAPILFSRTLALDWAGRAAFARDLGWARAADISPWTAPERRLDPIALRPAALARFCADRRRPAAVVAPGDQSAAVPPGWTAALWRPTAPFHRLWIDAGAIRSTEWDVFTVVRCPAAMDAGREGATWGDARSLG